MCLITKTFAMTCFFSRWGPVSTVSQTGLVTHTGRNTTYTQVSFHSSVYYKVFTACTECSVYCLVWWQRHFNDVSYHNIIIFVPTRQKERTCLSRSPHESCETKPHACLADGWHTVHLTQISSRALLILPGISIKMAESRMIPWEGHSCVGTHWGEHAGPPRPRPADREPTFIGGQNWVQPRLLWPQELRASLLHTDMISCEEMCGALVVPLVWDSQVMMRW